MSDTPEFTKLNSILKKFNERALNFLASKMLGETDMNLRNAIKFNYTDIYTASLEHNLPIARELKQIRNLYASIAPLNSTNSRSDSECKPLLFLTAIPLFLVHPVTIIFITRVSRRK